ncbi:E3 ubiquitin-protein ligase MYCBP2-like isoform X2 [Mya arenaria]|uniref:E3 ubiquitin-protein ligase MYCBP2-like isoform X2 n=1 Tax=Mya arenaria TaxID=6604 RepID=UPI0022E33B52|nr:E3 ubiquitin-protein ligase MYCBP2-like isoform X2 [Mya arenaria]
MWKFLATISPNARKENPSNKVDVASCKMNVKIKIGNLSAEEADVLVNSANQTLQLKTGRISNSMLTVAGPKLQQECTRRYPNGIAFGEVAVTKGYGLKCKNVYHVAVPVWDAFYVESLQILTQILHSCLQHANMDKMTSIAFPTLGCGYLNYPPEAVAETLFQCISVFGSDEKLKLTLQEVIIVVIPGRSVDDTKHLKQVFEAARSSILDLSSGTCQGKLAKDFTSTCVRQLALNSCDKTLHCGHKCGGYRYEKDCSPCLKVGCKATGKQNENDTCVICYTDDLSRAPVIMIKCGHIFHLHCVERVLQNRWVKIDHPKLKVLLETLGSLENKVNKAATARLEEDGLTKSKEITNPDGQYFNNPAGFATDKFIFYSCYACKKPYFAGEDSNGCASAMEDTLEETNLICSTCLARRAPKKGKDIQKEENVESQKKIKSTTKKCPHCEVNIEKNAGCNQMTCFVCGTSFCWLCETKWKSSCGSHQFDWTEDSESFDDDDDRYF